MLFNVFIVYFCAFSVICAASRSCSSSCECPMIRPTTAESHGGDELENSFSLLCADKYGNRLGDATSSWYFANGTEIPTNYATTGGTLNVTTHANSGTKNDTLVFRLSGEYHRSVVEGNYSCGCSAPSVNVTGEDARPVLAIVFEPLMNLDKPNAFVARIEEPFSLSSRFIFGANRNFLHVDWYPCARLSRGECETVTTSVPNRLQIRDTDLFFTNVREDDGPKIYTQEVSTRQTLSSESTTSVWYYDNRFRDRSPIDVQVFLIPYMSPSIHVSSPSLEEGSVVRLILCNGELLPREHKSVTFSVSTYPMAYVSNNISVNVSTSYYSINKYSTNLDKLSVSLKRPPNSRNSPFPSAISVTVLTALRIGQKEVSMSQPHFKLQKEVFETATKAVNFKIFEINSAQFVVTYESLCEVKVIRATVNITRPIPANFPYKIEFEVVTSAGREKLSSTDGSPQELLQSILLDTQGVFNDGRKVIIDAKMHFEIGGSGNFELGPQDTSQLEDTCTERETASTSSTIIIAVSSSSGGLALVIVLATTVIIVTIVSRKCRRRRPTPVLAVPFASVCASNYDPNMSDVASVHESIEGDSNLGRQLQVPIIIRTPKSHPYDHGYYICDIDQANRLTHQHNPSPVPQGLLVVPQNSRRHRNRSAQSAVHEDNPRHIAMRHWKRQRSFSANQIDENYSQQRFQSPSRSRQTRASSLPEERTPVEEDENEQGGLTMEVPPCPGEFSLGSRISRNTSEDRPASSLTTNSQRSTSCLLNHRCRAEEL